MTKYYTNHKTHGLLWKKENNEWWIIRNTFMTEVDGWEKDDPDDPKLVMAESLFEIPLDIFYSNCTFPPYAERVIRIINADNKRKFYEEVLK